MGYREMVVMNWNAFSTDRYREGISVGLCLFSQAMARSGSET